MLRHVSIKYLQYNNKLNTFLIKQANTSAKEFNISPCNCILNRNSHVSTHEETSEETSKPSVKTHTNRLSDKQYLVKLKNDPDVFGSAEDIDFELQESDLQEEQYLQEKPFASRKLSTKQYADIIKGLLKKRKIKEAIDVVEIQMLKEDKVKPENYLYNLLIGACGRVGYTKKAFSLYNDMKRRGLKITPGTYTALFNACSNSPWPTTDGLERAKHLRQIMLDKMYEPNLTNYNAMIKAFGRCGDLETSFALVDEMAAKRIYIQDDTLNFLLQACITDKEAGFRHALLVWRKFVDKKVRPSLYTYNLLLRCIRDCGLGDVEMTKDVIDRIVGDPQLLLTESQPKLITDGGNENENSIQIVLNKQTESDLSVMMNVPNLMAPVPRLGNILSIGEVQKPEDRLLLVGGCSGFLENMEQHQCSPDIKTFTQLLDDIPNTSAAEKDLLQALKKYNVKTDLDFYNMLIKKRSLRFDYEEAKNVLKMIKKERMLPNLITYGVLALGCKTKEEANSLLDQMGESNYRINVEILGAMLRIACEHNNFSYVMHILQLCHTEDVKPSQRCLEILDNFKKKCKKFSNDSTNKLFHSKEFQKGYRVFKARYKTWLSEIEIDKSEEVHPWQQYRQETKTNVQHYKDKQEKTRFKPVHTSLFRQKSQVENVNRK